MHRAVKFIGALIVILNVNITDKNHSAKIFSVNIV